MGTGVGVGTAWLVHGLGARDDVRVTTIDVDATTAAIAHSGTWPAFVSLLVADVLAVLDDLGSFDLIFADSQGGKWTGLPRTIAALRPGGLLLVDDMTPPTWMDDMHRVQTGRVRERLLGHEELQSVELACGSGMILAARRRPVAG
jgi:predicted O-methyltransferase YrrM